MFNAPGRHEPDEILCQTKLITPEFSRCLRNDEGCVHSVHYLDGCFCLHGRHLEFSLRDSSPGEMMQESGSFPRLMDYFSSVVIP